MPAGSSQSLLPLSTSWFTSAWQRPTLISQGIQCLFRMCCVHELLFASSGKLGKHLLSTHSLCARFCARCYGGIKIKARFYLLNR